MFLHDMMQALAANPFTKLIPETASIPRGLVAGTGPGVSMRLASAFDSGHMYGAFVRDAKEQPFWARQFAQYNFDFLKANQPDGDSIYMEDSAWYERIRGAGKNARVMQNQWGFRVCRKKWGKGAQATGDCTSWSKRFMNDALRARRIIKTGKWESWIERGATCGIYRGRGHTGQGADPVMITAYLCEIGTLLELEYDLTSAGGKRYDFREYDQYVDWGVTGGRVGMPKDLIAVTGNAKPLGYKVIRDIETVFDVIAAGGAVGCGASWGVQDRGNPLSGAGRPWGHDMAVCGIDTTREFVQCDVVAVDQSWGNWNEVTNVPDAWKPMSEGQFFVDAALYRKAIEQGGCTAIFDGQYFNAEADNAV